MNMGCPLEFVTFHVALGSSKEVHPNQTLKHREYLSMIDMMFASARLFHPEAKTTVLTDPDTDFHGMEHSADRTVRSTIDNNRFMLERADAQSRYVQDSSFARPMVMLDSDILINAPLAPLFGRGFDVAVTWRDNADMPINGGLLILNNTRPDVAKRFFSRFTAIYREKYSDQAAWFGDQLALRDCVGLGLADLAARETVEVDGCRILLLPCDTYNFSPDNRYGEICSELPGKVVVHFKGQRKRLMGPFWRAWLRSRHSYSPWVAFDGWRERRWLSRQSLLEMQTPGLVDDLEA